MSIIIFYYVNGVRVILCDNCQIRQIRHIDIVNDVNLFMFDSMFISVLTRMYSGGSKRERPVTNENITSVPFKQKRRLLPLGLGGGRSNKVSPVLFRPLALELGGGRIHKVSSDQTYPRYDDSGDRYAYPGPLEQLVAEVDTIPERYEVALDLEVVASVQSEKIHNFKLISGNRVADGKSN